MRTENRSPIDCCDCFSFADSIKPSSMIGISLFVFVLAVLKCSFLVYGMSRVYTGRKDLNETTYSKTRHAVSNFLNSHEMKVFEHFVRRHKHYFQRSTFSGTGNYFIFNPDKYGIDNYGIFSIPSTDPNITQYVRQQFEKYADRMRNPKHMENLRDFLFPSDVAVSILRSMGPLSEAHKVLLEEFEMYNYFRDKVCAYASEVFNTTAYPSVQPDIITFYYFPPKPQLEIVVNGQGYVFAPHLDARFVPYPYDRPLRYDFHDLYGNMYRKYSAVLFFTDVPAHTGGLFQWFDFPNNFNLPPAKGVIGGMVKDPNTGKDIHVIHSPTFADPDLRKTTVVPERAKLILFNAEDDIHASIAYTGDVERWACILQLTDKQSHIDQLNKAKPSNFDEKLAPKMNASLLKGHGQPQSSSQQQHATHTPFSPTSHPHKARRTLNAFYHH